MPKILRIQSVLKTLSEMMLDIHFNLSLQLIPRSRNYLAGLAKQSILTWIFPKFKKSNKFISSFNDCRSIDQLIQFGFIDLPKNHLQFRLEIFPELKWTNRSLPLKSHAAPFSESHCISVIIIISCGKSNIEHCYRFHIIETLRWHNHPIRFAGRLENENVQLSSSERMSKLEVCRSSDEASRFGTNFRRMQAVTMTTPIDLRDFAPNVIRLWNYCSVIAENPNASRMAIFNR